jgi:hypothetical protein
VKETPVSEKVVVFQQWKGHIFVATENGDFGYKVERVNCEYE